ncbi:co-chaperone protein p23-1-like isoform X2 [Senna tora]|uniref:Co-chaperone protein p23-1 n=1 Tax=Senna tora TaxID=362788 RepID=A0A834TNK3_9FABA|nr:co-chaperone protein p23-1-like isoform X2 [Senna tora]
MAMIYQKNLNFSVTKGDIVWARVQFPHQFFPALVLCTDTLGVCVSFFNHRLSPSPRYVIESEVVPFEQSFRWIMGRRLEKCETFYALLHSALKLMGQRVVSSLRCPCQMGVISSQRECGGRGRFDGLKNSSSCCFEPARVVGFVQSVAVLPWVDEVDFVDAVRVVAQVQAFRGYCSVEQKRVYEKTLEAGNDVKQLQCSSLGEKMHSVTQESVALKPKHESQKPIKQVEKNLAIGAVKRLNSRIPVMKGNVSSLHENRLQIIPQTQTRIRKAEFLLEISPCLTFDPFYLMGESLQYVQHGLSRFKNISEQNMADTFFQICCKMREPHFSIPSNIMTQLSYNFNGNKDIKSFTYLTKKRRQLDRPALCDRSFKLQKLSSSSSTNEASVNNEGFPPNDRDQETEGKSHGSNYIRPCTSKVKILELDKSIQKHSQSDIYFNETSGKVTYEVKQSFALKSPSNFVLGAHSYNHEVNVNPETNKASKGSGSTNDLQLNDTRVVSKTEGSTFESKLEPKKTEGSDSTLDQKRLQISSKSADKMLPKSKNSANIKFSSRGCLEKNENHKRSDTSNTMLNSKVGEQSKAQVSHACSKSLHMKFPKDFELPSKSELIKKFRVFGPVDHLKTRVFSFSGSAQVAFFQETDAVTAYLYAKTKKDSFGRANVRFWLDSFEHKRESPKYSTLMSPSSPPVPLKSCLKNSSSQKKDNRKKPYKKKKKRFLEFLEHSGCFILPTFYFVLPSIVFYSKLSPFFISIVFSSSLSTFAIPLQKMSRHPIVKWAQRSDKIYITVDLPDAKDVKLKLEPDGRFLFSAKKDEIPYEVDLELFHKVNVEESKYNIGVRSIVYVIKKAEKKWWDRLIKQEGKPPVFLKVDWDKWVDEEEENERAGMDFDDMDFSKLDMGGDDFDMDDSKEEEEEEIETEEKDGPKKEAAGEEATAPVADEAKA